MAINLTTNLEAFYKLDDVNDSSGNGNTLTNNGDVQFTSGKIGNAAEFNGSNYLRNDSLTFTNYTQLTIAGWVRFTDQATEPRNVISTGQSGDNGVGLGIYGDLGGDGGRVHFVPFNETEITVAAQPDVWYHFAIIGEESEGSGTYKFYVNNQLIDTVSDISWFDSSDKNGLFIGRSNEGQNALGLVDAVGIWNRALNDSEIAALYNEGNGLEEFSSLTEGSSFSVKIEGKTKFFGKVKFA
jgi:hypothetical protein